MNILGINSTYQEPSACFLKDGHIIAAVEEERFNEVKHGKDSSAFGSWLLPFNAINYCLETENITINEVEHISYSFKPRIRLKRNIPYLLNCISVGKLNNVSKEVGYYYFNTRIPRFLLQFVPKQQSIRKNFIIQGKPQWDFHFVEHHIAHAASCFFVSPFEEAAILTIDGIGESTSTFLGLGTGNRIERLREFSYPNSLGLFYEEITRFLGFERSNDEHKIMALAAYGRPKYFNNLNKLIVLKPDGKYKINIDFRKPSFLCLKELNDLLGPPRLWGAKIDERHIDIAASAQKILEETVLHILKWLHHQTKTENLCMAGGVALNCVLNERIRIESPFKNIFIQPAANDAGTSLGSALWVWHVILNHQERNILDHIYLGPEIDGNQIEEALRFRKIPYIYFYNIAQKTAEEICDGKIIGWIQGKMEWGPRALGNRSILADPRDPGIKSRLNNIKGREQFQPVAPVILEEAVADFFECNEPSPFMLFARRVRPEKKNVIPGAVHVDGTARIQTVNKTQNPLLYELIREFEKLTGICLLVNTSLNAKAKPIVCFIDQVLDCFYNTPIDCLVIGHYFIEKGLMHK